MTMEKGKPNRKQDVPLLFADVQTKLFQIAELAPSADAFIAHLQSIETGFQLLCYRLSVAAVRGFA
jgi:hypothetical protein